jgi:hypothetical protein
MHIDPMKAEQERITATVRFIGRIGTELDQKTESALHQKSNNPFDGKLWLEKL